MKTEDDSDDSVGKRSPILLGAADVVKPPPVRARPSFITNREYVPSLMVFATFAFLVYGVQWLASQSPSLGFFAAVGVFAFMAEWERRARYSLGRVRQRAHFDPLNLVKLPVPHIPPNIEMEPPTPWIPQNERARSDPATILKRAQDTIGGGGSQASESGAQSAMELALINLLKSAAAIKEAQTTTGDQSTGPEKPASSDKGTEPPPPASSDQPPPS